MGLVYLDANVFITALEAEQSIAAPVRRLFAAARSKPFSLTTSERTIAEVLAPPCCSGQSDAATQDGNLPNSFALEWTR